MADRVELLATERVEVVRVVPTVNVVPNDPLPVADKLPVMRPRLAVPVVRVSVPIVLAPETESVPLSETEDIESAPKV